MDISAIALQGLQQAEAQLQKVAAKLASYGASSPDGSNVDTVDLSAEMVAMIAAKNQAMVDLKTLDTAAEIQKSLVDLMA